MILQALNLSQGHLPFVVVGAVAWSIASIVGMHAIQAKIAQGVVLFVPIHVINALFPRQRTLQMLSHDHTMLGYRSALVKHAPEQRQIFVSNRRDAKHYIAALMYAFCALLKLIFSPSSGANSSQLASASSAMARVVIARHKLAQRVKRMRAHLSACGTGDIRRDRGPAVFPFFLIVRAYGRMSGQL